VTQNGTLGNLRRVSWEGRDDAELLFGARRDREAFAVFYRQHALVVYRWFAYRVEREGALASELTAETFAEALRSLSGFKGTGAGSGTSWLFGIARNLAREHHRTRRVRADARRDLEMPRAGSLDWSLEEAEDRIDVDRLGKELGRALALLPPAQREAVTLRIVDELDYPSIARGTATTEQAARLRVSRGLRALRRQLAAATNKEDS
jgi:RNA polymerase sigma factor (sigma-70 family)